MHGQTNEPMQRLARRHLINWNTDHEVSPGKLQDTEVASFGSCGKAINQSINRIHCSVWITLFIYVCTGINPYMTVVVTLSTYSCIL